MWPSRDQLQFPLQVQPALNIRAMMFPGKRTFFKQSTVCKGQKLPRETRLRLSGAHRHSWLRPHLLPRSASSSFSRTLSSPGEQQPPLLFNGLSLLSCGAWQSKRLFLAERGQKPWDPAAHTATPRCAWSLVQVRGCFTFQNRLY